jgi:hypothetical protein
LAYLKSKYNNVFSHTILPKNIYPQDLLILAQGTCDQFWSMMTSVCDDVFGLGKIGDWFEKIFGVIGDESDKVSRELMRVG